MTEVEQARQDLLWQIEHAPTQEAERTEQPAPLRLPDGPDWTRGLEPRSDDQSPQMLEVVRIAAFGRARVRMDAALKSGDQAQCDRLILQLIDFALEGADPRTILDGLL